MPENQAWGRNNKGSPNTSHFLGKTSNEVTARRATVA